MQWFKLLLHPVQAEYCCSSVVTACSSAFALVFLDFNCFCTVLLFIWVYFLLDKALSWLFLISWFFKYLSIKSHISCLHLFNLLSPLPSPTVSTHFSCWAFPIIALVAENPALGQRFSNWPTTSSSFHCQEKLFFSMWNWIDRCSYPFSLQSFIYFLDFSLAVWEATSCYCSVVVVGRCCHGLLVWVWGL